MTWSKVWCPREISVLKREHSCKLCKEIPLRLPIETLPLLTLNSNVSVVNPSRVSSYHPYLVLFEMQLAIPWACLAGKPLVFHVHNYQCLLPLCFHEPSHELRLLPVRRLRQWLCAVDLDHSHFYEILSGTGLYCMIGWVTWYKFGGHRDSLKAGFIKLRMI